LPNREELTPVRNRELLGKNSGNGMAGVSKPSQFPRPAKYEQPRRNRGWNIFRQRTPHADEPQPKRETKAHAKIQRRKDGAKKNKNVIPSTPKRFDEYRPSKSLRSCSSDFYQHLIMEQRHNPTGFSLRTLFGSASLREFFAFSATISL